MQARGVTLKSEIHKLINSIRNKEELPDQWKESIIVLIYKKDDKTDCSNYQGISLLSASDKIVSNIHLLRLSPLGIISVGFDETDQLLIRIFAFVR
jgi:hypothetical protein